MQTTSSNLRVATTILLMFLGAAASAADKDAGPTVTFDHLGGLSESQAVSAKPGQVITIQIENTCPDDFKYDLGGIPLQTPDPQVGTRGACAPVTHTLTQLHDPQYGGYYVRAIRKDQTASVQANKDGVLKELKELTFLVLVATSQWDIGFAGGFTVSDVTDPVFAAVDDGTMQSIIARDTSAEDEVSMGLAAMIHLYHHKHPQWAASFGLSTSDSGDVAYMVGPSFRFSDKAAITLGYMWAPVDRLPSGLSVGDPLPDSNSLSNLQSKVEGGVFLGFSYSFITGIKDAFDKPFKGSSSD